MSANEFDIIARYFAPLTKHAGARGLSDDVAVIEVKGKLVITTDAVIEGVHFLPDDPIDTVAKKALRVNLSDLAAKGAKPVGIVLSLMWPNDRPAAQIADFARGLGEDLDFYDVALLGGDTTSTPGPLAISITAFGEALGQRVPSRADATAGEHVWVTGRIGDAFLGLKDLTSAAPLGATPGDQTDAHAAYMRARYRIPEPPLAFAPAIARLASASMDVSDGLIADARKIAAASRVGLRLDADGVALSAAGHAYVATRGHDGLLELLYGGDDYQVLFTAAPECRGEIMRAAREAGVDVALIGDVGEGAGVRLVFADGTEAPIADGGHRHKLGR